MVKHGNSEDKNSAHRVIYVSITQMLQKHISDDVTYMWLYAETLSALMKIHSLTAGSDFNGNAVQPVTNYCS